MVYNNWSTSAAIGSYQWYLCWNLLWLKLFGSVILRENIPFFARRFGFLGNIGGILTLISEVIQLDHSNFLVLGHTLISSMYNCYFLLHFFKLVVINVDVCIICLSLTNNSFKCFLLICCRIFWNNWDFLMLLWLLSWDLCNHLENGINSVLTQDKILANVKQKCETLVSHVLWFSNDLWTWIVVNIMSFKNFF